MLKRIGYLALAGLSVGLFSWGSFPVATVAAQNDPMVIKLVNRTKLKWSKQVPGYDKDVQFNVKWPRNGLVVGHSDLKTAILLSIGKFAAGKEISLGVKMVSWAYTLKTTIENFGKMNPLGICRARSGTFKGWWGQLDALTGYAGLSDATCYVPYWKGGGISLTDTTDFDVLTAPPVFAHWVERADYTKNIKKFDRINYFAKYKRDKKLDGLICRAFFKDNVAAFFKGKTTTTAELLSGVVLNGKCVVLFKEAVTGVRFPHKAREFEILILEKDYAQSKPGSSLRDGPIALKHKASGLCLSLGNDSFTRMIKCNAAPNGKQTPLLELTGSGRLKARLRNVCLSVLFKGASLKCSKSELATQSWFISKDGYLRGPGGTCLGVPKRGQKVNGVARVTDNCNAQKLGTDHQWSLVEFGGLYVEQSNSNIPLKVNISGYPTNTCLKNPGDTSPCFGFFMNGTSVKVQVKNREKVKFQKWTGGPCKNKTNPSCSFKVSKNTKPLEFAVQEVKMTDEEKMREMGILLKVKHSGKCIDKTRSQKKGVQMISWSCSRKNKNQLFEIIDSGRSAATGKLKFIRLRNKASKLCLDVKGASKKNGAQIIQWPCTSGSLNQIFEIHKMDQKNWFNIKSMKSDKCVDLAGGSKKNGAKFIQYTCNTKSANQRFVIN